MLLLADLLSLRDIEAEWLTDIDRETLPTGICDFDRLRDIDMLRLRLGYALPDTLRLTDREALLDWLRLAPLDLYMLTDAERLPEALLDWLRISLLDADPLIERLRLALVSALLDVEPLMLRLLESELSILRAGILLMLRLREGDLNRLSLMDSFERLTDLLMLAEALALWLRDCTNDADRLSDRL